MRIPSNLNRPTLYGASRRGPADDGSTRKLLRLVLALALVVVVMRQAARVEWYEPFFAEPPDRTSLPNGPYAPNGDVSPAGDERPPAGLPRPVVGLEYNDGRDADGERADAGPADGERADSERADSEQGEAGDVGRDAGAAEGRADAGPGAAGDLLADVADGSVWRGSDFPAFYHLLAAAAERAGRPQVPSPPGPLVGVLPLLQQPDIYRGRAVRVRGRVARSTRRQAAANEHGLGHYWELWLRPHDGSDRPLLAIVPDVPGVAESENGWGVDPRRLASRASLSDGPWVSVDGRFLKRLAYRSAAGVELTPVVIGRLSTTEPLSAIPGSELLGREEAVGSPATEAAPAAWGRKAAMLAGVLVAILVGVGLGWLAIWRSSADAARVRRLRAGELARSARWIESADPSASATDGSARRDPSQGGG